MKIQVECTVESTKSPKWLRLAPAPGSPIGPVMVKADQLNGNSKPTVTVTA